MHIFRNSSPTTCCSLRENLQDFRFLLIPFQDCWSTRLAALPARSCDVSPKHLQTPVDQVVILSWRRVFVGRRWMTRDTRNLHLPA